MTDSSVDRAHAKAKSKAWTVEKIRSQLDSIPQFDHKFWAHCKSMQDELVPALLEAMQNQASMARLNASLLLLHLGEPNGTDGIIACLRDPDETLREKTLLHLSLLPPEPFFFAKNSPYTQSQPVSIKKAPLFAELRTFLSQSNAYHIGLALSAIRNMNLSGTETHIQPLLKHPSRDVRAGALSWYASRSDSADAFPAAEELLFAEDVLPTDNFGIVQSLGIYCKRENQDLAVPAAELLARFILAYVDYPGNYMANLISNAMNGLKVAGYIQERQLAQAVFQSKEQDWRRGAALRRLAEINGKTEINLLQESLSDRILRPFAAQGITIVFEGRDEIGLTESLIQALWNENRENDVGHLISALIAVTGRSAASLVEGLKPLPPYEAMRVHWLSNKIDPQKAVSLLVKAKVIIPPAQEQIRRIEEEWDTNYRASSVVFNLLTDAERLFWFDGETGKVPVDYIWLLEEFVKISHGVFDAESFSQETDKETGETEVQFVLGNRVHTLKTHDYGDWYDVESLLQGVNEALSKLGRSEQFIWLYTGDQTCAVTFAPERAFRKAAHALRLPLEDDFQDAIAYL